MFFAIMISRFLLDPSNTTQPYYEIEVNALNTIFDLLLNKPYRNEGKPIISWDVKGLRSAVKIQGALNDASDKDEGWTVEMAIPFKSISLGKPKSSAKGRCFVAHQFFAGRMGYQNSQWQIC